MNRQTTLFRSYIVVLLFCSLLFLFHPDSCFASPQDTDEEPKGSLVIVTSFPETLFKQFKTHFEKKFPNVTLFIRNKKTSAAISFIKERRNEPADIFWASAPDAFEILKDSGDLLPLFKSHSLKTIGIGHYPLNDPDGFYRGFAISGYGICWNESYINKYNLPVPAQWRDLKSPIYAQHIGISSPSRSGTTHLIIEIILQQEGWKDGWAFLSEIGGNLITVTARSYGVIDGVVSGRFGIGPVIDFFGLSANNLGHPVHFTYPKTTVLLPASIGIVARTTNLRGAKAFADFVLSEEGQRLLLKPEISRLPVHRDMYQFAPSNYPNPFQKELAAKTTTFDTELSRARYHTVNSLFDILITYRLKQLRRIWKLIHQAEKGLAGKRGQHHPALRQKLKQARQLASAVPLGDQDARDTSLSTAFGHHKPGLPVSSIQLRLEEQWRRQIYENGTSALQLAQEVIDQLEQMDN